MMTGTLLMLALAAWHAAIAVAPWRREPRASRAFSLVLCLGCLVTAVFAADVAGR